MSLIEFKNISKSFASKQVLNKMNLFVEEGETLTIIGGSGTGKSVSLKLLLGLIESDEGEIIFKGNNICDLKESELLKIRSHIGILFQNAALFDSLTVHENVAYPLREHFRYSEEKISEIVREKLDHVGLKDIEELYPSDLSGGMRKRVGLARALANDPEVILYDEPTAGLDPANTNRIAELIVDLQKVLKVTSIVVTHHMDFAFEISNRMALLHNQKIEFIGTVDEVKNSTNQIVQNFINGEIGDSSALV